MYFQLIKNKLSFTYGLTTVMYLNFTYFSQPLIKPYNRFLLFMCSVIVFICIEFTDNLLHGYAPLIYFDGYIMAFESA